MIKKQVLMAAGLCTALLLSGCGKKHEKIDLSSKHTTAAETMAETMAPSVPETTEADSIDVTLEAGIENAAGTGSSGSVSGSVTNTNGVKTEMASYTSGKVSIQYPVISSLGDEKAQTAVNDLIKTNALSVLKAYEVDEATDTLDIQCKVLEADRNRITITYEGSVMAQGAAYPVSLFYSNTVDVRNISNIDLPQMADPNKLATYVLSDECVFLTDDSAAVREMLKTVNEAEKRNQSYYAAMFNQADFPVGSSFPSCFSYEQDGDVYFSIPVPHAAGDYVIAIFTPENK